MKLSICVDMGAINNGIFIAKTNEQKLVSKKATCIKLEKKSINFSKKSRRDARHIQRNIKRRKLAKRLLREMYDFSTLNDKQEETLLGLLNNRGYTFLNISSDFESLEDDYLDFFAKYFEKYIKKDKEDKTNFNDFKALKTKDEFETFFSAFDEQENLIKFLKYYILKIPKLEEDFSNFCNKKEILEDLRTLQNKNQLKDSKKKIQCYSYIKNLFYKNNFPFLGKTKNEFEYNIFKEDFKISEIDFKKEEKYILNLPFDSDDKKNKIILKKNLKDIKDFLGSSQKELETGAKPREKYLDEIYEEIMKLDFIENKKSFYNLVGNISNLQLRMLRKVFNAKSNKNKFEILKKYFKAFHYKSLKEKERRENLNNFISINPKNNKENKNLKDFLTSCPPKHTIPPYEDMNNRGTYKCNSLLVNPEIISDDLKSVIDIILKNDNFSNILGIDNKTGEFNKSLDYSVSIQRILDSTQEITSKELNPRNVFKKSIPTCIDAFKRVFGIKVYENLKEFAKKYYKEETQIISGIHKINNSLFKKCSKNTPYKNNVKHMLLKPIFSYDFTEEEADIFLDKLKNTKGLVIFLELISKEASQYKNNFKNTFIACKNKSSDENKMNFTKEIEKIVSKLGLHFLGIKDIFTTMEIKTSFLEDFENLNKDDDFSRFVFCLRQVYDILFKDLNGFAKTCKICTEENATRSNGNVIAKRLLSDVAKPIDGMLDMLLERLAYEISQEISEEDLKDINEFEILLEENRFNFEKDLRAIKNNKKEIFENDKNILDINICPYLGERIVDGDYDHILAQSKTIYNSKANMIYVSTKANQEKRDYEYPLDRINEKHLRIIFGSQDITTIKNIIKTDLEPVYKNINTYTNFGNLKLKEQKAFRYALYLKNDKEYKEVFSWALELLKRDKLKAITNGTQKRLAKLIYEKLANKYPKYFISEDEQKQIIINSKTINCELVRGTRNLLARDDKKLAKQEIQNLHSHCIDAMLVFYLANARIKGKEHQKKNNISEMEPIFNFKDIYLEDSSIKNLGKNKTFITSDGKEEASFRLFKSTIYKEQYHLIKINKEKQTASCYKKNITKKDFETLLKYNLIYQNIRKKGEGNKKNYPSNIEDIKEDDVLKIDVSKTSNLILEFFNSKNKKGLSSLKFLDDLRFCTTRKNVRDIFIKDNALLDFEKIESIPQDSIKTFKALYKVLKNSKNIFSIVEKKKNLNEKELESTLKNFFSFKESKRKRAKKRHIYSFAITGSASFRIKRQNTWQVVSNEKITTRKYLCDNKIQAIPFFSKNTLPLKIKDLIPCLSIDSNSKQIYKVSIENINKIVPKIKSLTYFLSEAKRCTILVSFIKKEFENFDFSTIKSFNSNESKEFQNFIENFINYNQNLKDQEEITKIPDSRLIELSDCIGGIRNAISAKNLRIKKEKEQKITPATAVLEEDNDVIITIRYSADFSASKQKIILEAINEISNNK